MLSQKMPPKYLLRNLAIPLAALVLVVLTYVSAFAQTSTTSTVVGLEQVLKEAAGTAEAFKTLGLLAGFAALMTTLVSFTKTKLADDFIRAKKIKWVRPVIAILGGIVGGVLGALAQGKGAVDAAMYGVTGFFVGGGAIAIHELFAVMKGERST